MSTDTRPTEHPIDPLFTRRGSPRAYTGALISEASYDAQPCKREEPSQRCSLRGLVADGRCVFGA